MSLTQAYFPAAQADFLPVAQAAMAAKPDFILAGAGVAQELSLFKALITLNNTIPVGTYAELIPVANLPQIAAAKFPIVVDAPFPDPAASTDPEVALYRQWMQKSGYGDELGESSLSGWITGRVLQVAINEIQKSGSAVSRANVLKQLRTGTLKGVALLPSSLTLANAPKQTEGFGSLVNPTENVAKIQNGKKTVLSDTVTIP
jgi:hypothetical protein